MSIPTLVGAVKAFNLHNAEALTSLSNAQALYHEVVTYVKHCGDPRLLGVSLSGLIYATELTKSCTLGSRILSRLHYIRNIAAAVANAEGLSKARKICCWLKYVTKAICTTTLKVLDGVEEAITTMEDLRAKIK